MSSCCVVAGEAHPRLAGAIAEIAGAVLVPTIVSAFSDGETRVRLGERVAGSDLYILEPTSPPVNERLVTLALIADAARAAGARRVTAIIPYFGYARQDARKNEGEARSAQLAARVLECAGIDRIVALDLHAPALESAFRIPVTHLDAGEAAVPAIRGWRLPAVTVVSPDAGGLKRAQRYASALDGRLAVIAKTRPRSDASLSLAVLGDVRDRHCVIVDDMVSTGGTVVGAAERLRDAGAASVHAFFVHAPMAPSAVAKMRAAGVRHIATTNSIAPAKDEEFQTVEIADIGPLLARTVVRLAGR